MSDSLQNSTGLTSPIQFVEIPYNWKVPGDYMEVQPAVNLNAVLDFPARGLVTGQMYATGTAVAGTRYPIYTSDQASGLFGAGSELALMCAAWLQVNPYTPVDAMGIADAAESVKATGAITLAGVATASGTLPVYIGGVRIPVGVAVGDTAAEVADNLFAVMVLQGQPGYPYLPWTVPAYAANAVAVTLTSGHGGTIGNAVDIRLCAEAGETVPAGLTVTITAMNGGATDPSETISAALSAITNTWYTDVAWPWLDETNISTLSAWLTTRYGAMQKLDASAYVSFSGTYGAILAFEPNLQFIHDLPQQNPMTPGPVFAAAFAAACSYQTAQQPSLQLRTVPLPGIRAPADADQFDPNERQALLLAGHSTFLADSTGNVTLERVATTLRTNANGAPSSAYFDISSVKTPTRVRYDWNNYCAQLYPRNTLTNDGTIGAGYDPNAVTPSVMKASWTGRSTVYEQRGWLQNTAQMAAASTFEINADDGNRLDTAQPIDIMGNLMVLAGQLQFLAP